jgi:hypothetical protein
MPVQAVPLALAASLYPLGLAPILLLAEAVRPRPKVGVFLIGALAVTLAIASGCADRAGQAWPSGHPTRAG